MRNTNKLLIWTFGFLLAFALALFPSAALANFAFPLVLIFLSPPFAIALLPIIAIEALYYYYNKSLNLKLKDAFVVSILANLTSTILGLPVLGIVSFLGGFGWLGAGQNISLSIILLLIIGYFVSVFIEKEVIAAFSESFSISFENEYLTRCVWIANSISYTFLVLYFVLIIFNRW